MAAIEPFVYTETTAAKERDLLRLKINEIIEKINPFEITIEEILESIDDLQENKQGKLTAGTNITIDENNVISASGGGGSATFETLGGEPRDNEKLALEFTTIEDAIDEKADATEITALWTGVNEEAATRQTADETLQERIDDNAGDIAALQADLLQEVTDREEAIENLDDAKEDKFENATAIGQVLKSTDLVGGKVWSDSDKWFAVPDYANSTLFYNSGWGTSRTIPQDGFLGVYVRMDSNYLWVYNVNGKTVLSGYIDGYRFSPFAVKKDDIVVGTNNVPSQFEVYFFPIRWIKITE